MQDASPSRPKRWPLGFLGMIALVMATERGLDPFAATLVNMTQWGWRFTHRSLPSQAPGRDILCFGDSLAMFGIQPRVLQERLPGRGVYNLAILCGQTPSSYFLFRRALAAGARPSAVVLNTRRCLLACDLTINDLHWAEMLTDRECLELAWTARDADFFAKTFLGIHLISYRERDALRKNVLGAFGGQDTATLVWNRGLVSNIRQNQGAAVFWPVPHPPQTVAAPAPPGTRPGPWNPRPYNVEYLRRFFALAASKGIAVYWVDLPECPANEDQWTRSGDRQIVDRYTRNLLAEFPNVVAVSTPQSSYPDALYYDDAHLSRHGATILSEDFAEVLAHPPSKADGSARRVQLPPFVERADPVRLEDFGESTTAMRAREAAETVRR